MAACKTHCNVTPKMLDSVLIGCQDVATCWPLEQFLCNKHRCADKLAHRPD